MSPTRLFQRLITLAAALGILFSANFAFAEVTIPAPDRTPNTPLPNPAPAASDPRYISGFGENNAYVLFYEDRADHTGCTFGSRIYLMRTLHGPFEFTPPTPTNICDTHFVVKNWPVTINGTTYAYRAWGSVGNNPEHNFYVSHDLTHWVRNPQTRQPFYFQDDTETGQTVYYGFHDIIRLNNDYVGFAETNTGHTVIVRSSTGTTDWHVVAVVGSGTSPGNGPLYFPTGIGPTPTGVFLLMEVNGEKVYGKLMVPGDNSGAYLAINRAAAQAATPAEAEDAFLDPQNWTWSDGTVGAPTNASLVLPATANHDVREVWSPPTNDYQTNPPILYTARYTTGSALGCAATTTDCTVQRPPNPTPAPTASPHGGLLLPVTGFSHTITTLPPQQHPSRAFPLTLEVPTLGLRAPIVGVPHNPQGWDVTWLGNTVGWLQGTAFPTWAGNTVLTGHVWNADNTPGIFLNLKRLRFGDRITIHAWGNIYTYAVQENRLLTPNEVNIALAHKNSDWLTLLTCEGYLPATGGYRYRRMVRAVRVETFTLPRNMPLIMP